MLSYRSPQPLLEKLAPGRIDVWPVGLVSVGGGGESVFVAGGFVGSGGGLVLVAGRRVGAEVGGITCVGARVGGALVAVGMTAVLVALGGTSVGDAGVAVGWVGSAVEVPATRATVAEATAGTRVVAARVDVTVSVAV